MFIPLFNISDSFPYDDVKFEWLSIFFSIHLRRDMGDAIMLETLDSWYHQGYVAGENKLWVNP